MDEGSETGQDIPAFIRNALKQLISLKSNISSIDDFHNDMKQINVSVNTDINDFANKVKEFLDSFQIQISDINNTFIKSYEAFLKKNDGQTCKRNLDSENTNFDSCGVPQDKKKTDTFFDEIENSDSDVPLVKVKSKRGRKTLKQKNNEGSDSDTNLKSVKTCRRKKTSNNILECDNSDSEHAKSSDKHDSKSSSIQNTNSEETLASDDTLTLKLNNIKSNLGNKADNKTNNDSDKENTKNINATSKEIINEKIKKPETTDESINSDIDSEKETTEKTSKVKSKKHVESNSDTDSGENNSKENKKKHSKKEKTKKNTESDIDFDLIIKKSEAKIEEKKYNIVTLTNGDSDSEKNKSKTNDVKNKRKSKIEKNAASDKNIINTDENKKDYVSESDSDKNITETEDSKNQNKSKIQSDFESNTSIITNTEKNETGAASDNDADKEKNKFKTNDSKLRKKSKTVKDSNSDTTIIKNTEKNKNAAISDNDSESDKNTINKEKTKKVTVSESDSDSTKNKTKTDYSKSRKKSQSVNDSDSDEPIIKITDKTKKYAVSDRDSDSEKTQSKTGDSKKKKGNKSLRETDSSDTDLEKTQSKTDDSKYKNKGNKSLSETDSDKEKSEETSVKHADDSKDSNTKDKENNKGPSLDSDSDSYLEDPRTIIEKSKKALAEKRKSVLKSKPNNIFDSLKESENLDTLTEKTVLEKGIPEKNTESNNTTEVDDTLKGIKGAEEDKNREQNKNSSEDFERFNTSSPGFNLSSNSDISSTELNKATNDDNLSDDGTNETESTKNTQNENFKQETVNGEDNIQSESDNENKKEEKQKVGLIKCIDISKLLDPKVQKIQKSSILDTSVIILSSTESDTDANSKKSKSKSKKHKTDDKLNKRNSSESNKTKNIDKSSKNKDKYEEKSNKNSSKSKIEIDSDSSFDGGKRRLRYNRKKENVSKISLEQLRTLRERRAKKKPIVKKSSSSSNSDSESSESSNALQKLSVKSKCKRPKLEMISEIDPNYDYKKDSKFTSKCYISLPKTPVENLKALYLQEREDAEINRVTNMKSLKRARQQKGTSSSSSENDAKTVKKRGKLQPRKKISDEEEQSEYSNDSMSDVAIIQDNNEKNVKLSIPEDLLDSDGDINKHSNSSDDEDKDKKKKNGDKKKSDKKTDTEKDKDDTEENGKDKEKEKEDKEKSKWRNDPLLRGKLNASDSEDELIRFKSKKNKIAEDIRSEPEEETIVSKKSKTKKQLKRIARRLGSDVSSSEDENEEYKKSDNENENSDKSEKNLSSDSEEDNQNKKKPMRRRIKRIKDSDESSNGENGDKKDKKSKKEEDDLNTRKKIRHVWSKDSLADSTKEAAKEEEERKKRIADRQKLYNEIYDNKLDLNAEVDKVVLDFNEDTKEELLSVHPDLVKKLKPHQAKGVQFMWTACFESIERAQNTEGSGCILAHCMGLGKTLQVITLIHTLLSNSENSNVKTVLVVCPLSTVLNWVAEFKKWLDDLDGEQVNVFDLVQYKQNYERLYQMQDWMKFGGVMVMGYDMFRNLSNPKGKRMSKKLINGFNKVLLEPGPDLVVCDEGHLLKNEKTGISIAMNQLKSLRRIVLTGTPLQNNLKEYFCMVQFVKPNLLGTYKEYLNRFVNPITNGQYTDSTPHDIQIMRKRAHVLHKMLDAVVERRDYNVLAPFLPPKHEYVLFVSLAAVQIELYREYLTKFSRNTNVKGTSYLFQDFQELQRICIHPRVLLEKSNQDKMRKDMEDDDSEGSLKDFINDDESDKSTSANESSSGSDSESDKKASVPTRRTRANPGNIDDEVLVPEILSRDEWWSKFCQGDELDNICHSSKIKLLFDILHQCELIGDKILVFSQSLYSLNLIEYFLARVDEATQSGDTESLDKVGGHTSSWALGLDYFRMDGSTSCDNRATWCKTFNNEANTRARLFLISTRAGGLGINLVAANRVIIFDVSWNPSFDIQSIYRVYRFGQTKPCYVYRFVTMGTMENKIYERQVTKQAISKRVIDEQQIDRHYNQTDLAELYAFVPIPDEERPTPLVPKDRLFADLLQSHEKQIFKYHEHNSLLEDKADEGLNEEERQAAWEEFENEKKAPKFNLMQTMVRNGMFETLRILVQEDNSGWTPAQINNILPAVVQRISEQVARGDYSMYRRVEERHEMRVLEQRRMQLIYQQYLQQLRSASGGNPMTPADMNKLAQMFSAYNQTMAVQQQMQPRSQIAGSSSAVSFNQGDPPPQMTAAPIPHPAISEVVELND